MTTKGYVLTGTLHTNVSVLVPGFNVHINRSRMSPKPETSSLLATFKEQTTLVYTSGRTADNSG